MNKRGDELMGRTIVEIMIAIVCVIILIYFGYVLFQSYLSNQKDTQAKEQLITFAKELESSTDIEKTVHLIAPKGWHVVSFDLTNNFNNDFERPTLMFNRNSVCICKTVKCTICKETSLPVRSGTSLIDIVIAKDINVTKTVSDFSIKVL